ncbi:immunoglobulin domain-containing protein, partial [Flavobacteriaceae bacterium]|nr:immunoglobulin domain-containing protein [Flavobacteriaceae bacterium]
MNKINLIGLLLFTTTLSVFANTNETVKSNLFINQFETSNVSADPSITIQPQSTLDVCLGDAIALSIVASPGNGTVSYQWQKDGVDITNATATTANLNIPASVAADAGNYICIVTDADGDITSDPSTVTVNSLQINIDNLSGDFILCEGEQITLTASGASSYNWDNGFSTDNDIVETPTTTTSYSVTGKDSNGCEASTSVQVVVNPLPTATVTSNGSICSGSDAVFEFTGTPGAEVIYELDTTEYTITLSPSGSFGVSISNPLSNQTVSLVEVSNTNCDVTLNISETVSVQTIPAEPTVTNIGPYCQGDPSFSIASLVTGTDLKWYLASSGGSSQSTPPTQNTTNPGTFSYYVSQTINGCESPRAEVEVVVNATPVISISGNNSICVGESAQLTVNELFSSYVWSPGGETTSSIPATPTTTTTYSVIGTDANGCSNSAQITVTVNAEPTASVNAGSSPICSGEDAVFTITGTPGAEVTYKLNAGAETNITLSSSGSYSLPITNATLDQEISLLKVTNTITNCDVTLNITETVIVEPITPMPAVTNPPSYCQGDSSFSIASSASGTDLKWYLASSSGSPLSSPPTPVTLNPGTFSYYVSQTINGCESPRAEVEVVVNATPVISISGNN